MLFTIGLGQTVLLGDACPCILVDQFPISQRHKEQLGLTADQTS